MAMTEVAQATVTIIPNMKGSQAKISKDLGASTDSAGESAGLSFGSKMVGAIKKVAAVAAIGKFIGDSLNAGADLQQSLGGIETLFKENADVVKGYASEAYKTAGLSANDYMESVTSFSASLIKSMDGDTAAAAELANTAMIDMSDNANKMGTDMSSIQNAYQGFAKQNYTMLDNLKLGYGGTKEEMQRLLADASELSGVEYDISNLDDVYSAIHVIQEDLGITGTTAKEASETFSGSFASMKAAAKDLMGNLALGNDITPQLQNLGESVQTFVVGNVLPMVGNIVKQIPSVLAQLPGMIAEMIPTLLPAMADMVAGLAQGIIDNLPTWVAGVEELWSTVWDSLVNIDWTAAGQIVVDLLKAAWEGLKDIASGIWDAVVGVFTGEVEFPDLSGAAELVWNALVDIASEIWEGVKGVFASAIDFLGLSDIASAAWEGITDVATGIWDTVTGIFGADIEFPSLSEMASAAWDTLSTLAQTIWDTITGIFTGDIEFPSLSELASAAWEGLTDIASTVWDSVTSVFTADISFPSLDSLASAAWSTLSGIASGIWSGIQTVFSAADITFADLSATASAAWSGLSGVASGIWDGIKEIFSSFDITWPDFGELASGALEGLKNAAKGVWDWVKGLFSGDSDDEAVKSVKGSTDEMAAAFADAELKVSSVDVSSIQTANEFVKNTVLGWKRMFDNMSWKLPSVGVEALGTAKNHISTSISGYKQKMNFSWSLPTLHGRLPVISVNMQTASSSDGKTTVSYPNLSVSSFKWFAEGGVFNAPTIIGIGDSKGPEAAVPLDMMWRQLGKEFDKHFENAPSVTNYFDIHADNPQDTANEIARTLKMQLRMA